MSKFVSVLKKYVVGPVMTAVGAVVAAVSAGGTDLEPKAVLFTLVGALLGAVLHKEVVVRFAGEE